MAVFRVQKTGDYTVMSNYHLRDKRLLLRAKGLLSLMLSLPEDWDYTLAGLAQINKEGRGAIGTIVQELEKEGYVSRRQMIGDDGRFMGSEYIIYEQPAAGRPLPENPATEIPAPHDPAQQSTDRENTEEQITDQQKHPSFRSPCTEGKGREVMSAEQVESYRRLIYGNIEYERLQEEYPLQKAELEEISELILEEVCSNRKFSRIAGSDFPQEIIRARFLKFSREHIEYVMDCLAKNTSEIRCMKQYLLAVLYNAPATMSNYYAARVGHDLADSKW